MHPTTGQINELERLIERAQSSGPLDRVTVLVPTRPAGVHLRRALGTARGLCNVVFELARPELAQGTRPAVVPIVREALRQVLLAGDATRTPLAHSPRAVSE